MIIGLTGGIGSGKSSVAAILEEHGFLRVDADEVSRSLTGDGSPMLDKITELFGAGYVKDGSLDRKALANLVFSDKEKLLELNNLMHGEILKACLEMMAAYPEKDVVFDVPQLFEAGWDCYCDSVWVVCADIEKRIERVVKRDGSRKKDVLARISNQMSDEERIARADVVIYNNSDEEELRTNVLKQLDLLYN